MLYLSNSFRSLRVPIVPAQMPDSSQNPLLDHSQFIRLASADIAGAVLASIGSKPTGHCIDIHPIAVTILASSISSKYYPPCKCSPDQNFFLAHSDDEIVVILTVTCKFSGDGTRGC